MVPVPSRDYRRVIIRIPVSVCWKCCVDGTRICDSVVEVSWKFLYDSERLYSLEYKSLVRLVRGVFEKIVGEHECIIAEDLAVELLDKLAKALHEIGVGAKLLGRLNLALEFHEPLGGEKIPVRVEA